MKAVVYEQYGPPEVLEVKEIAKPTPKDNEVLVKVRATTVTKGDVRMRSFTVPPAQWLPARLYLGIRKPRRTILGMELAGDIEAIGKDVTRFKVGDAVFASTFEVNFGGYAEYKCLPEDGAIALKPANVSYEEAAAAVGGGITALRCLEQAHIQPGEQVLIYGASGAVGTNAVQMAKRVFGAEVTGVCSTSNLDLVTSLGADVVIDYTQEDFTQRGAIYDVVFDAVGLLSPAHAKKALKLYPSYDDPSILWLIAPGSLRALMSGGVYLNVNKHSNGSAQMRIAAMQTLKDLMEAGTLKSAIDRCYPLAEIVEAHRYVDKGHKKGNVAITVA